MCDHMRLAKLCSGGGMWDTQHISPILLGLMRFANHTSILTWTCHSQQHTHHFPKTPLLIKQSLVRRDVKHVDQRP